MFWVILRFRTHALNVCTNICSSCRFLSGWVKSLTAGSSTPEEAKLTAPGGVTLPEISFKRFSGDVRIFPPEIFSVSYHHIFSHLSEKKKYFQWDFKVFFLPKPGILRQTVKKLSANLSNMCNSYGILGCTCSALLPVAHLISLSAFSRSTQVFPPLQLTVLRVQPPRVESLLQTLTWAEVWLTEDSCVGEQRLQLMNQTHGDSAKPMIPQLCLICADMQEIWGYDHHDEHLNKGLLVTWSQSRQVVVLLVLRCIVCPQAEFLYNVV